MPNGRPDAEAGTLIFNNAHKVMQYCNGSDWIGIWGGGSGNGGGGSGGGDLPECGNKEIVQYSSGSWGCNNGSGLDNLNATNLKSGTVPIVRLGSSGTRNNTTFLRGDNTWASPSTTEVDPKVGTLTNGRWCTTNGSVINCTQTAPVLTEADPKVGAVTNNKWCRGNGSAVVCDQDAPSANSSASTQTYTANATWTKPSGASMVHVECIGGGSSGWFGYAGETYEDGISEGGDGGTYASIMLPLPLLPSTVAITIGAGGAARTSAGVNPGGNSSFGNFLIALGGGTGGTMAETASYEYGGKGGDIGRSTAWSNGKGALYAGAGGGASGGFGQMVRGSGGTSQHAGNGGAGAANATSNGAAGVAPGGGGGGFYGTGRSSGAGARGQCRVTTW